MDTLKELYIDQLQDLWSANRQAAQITKKLCDAATDEDLSAKLEKSCGVIEEHNKRLEKLIRNYDEEPDAEHCKGMEGLVKEAKKHALEEDFGDDAVCDASIIAQYQRICHYGIAAYGTCCALAEQLNCKDDVKVLSEDLKSVKEGDAAMTKIAVGSVNRKAA